MSLKAMSAAALAVFFCFGCTKEDAAKPENARMNSRDSDFPSLPSRASTGTSSYTSQKLEVTATVFKDFYSSFTAGGGDVQYKIKVTVTNKGPSTISCQAIEGSVFSLSGKGLSMPTMKTDGTFFELKPGIPEDFSWETNGYTSDLLLQAGGNPLLFSFKATEVGGKKIGPYLATLPSIKDLPTEYSGQTGQKLNFR